MVRLSRHAGDIVFNRFGKHIYEEPQLSKRECFPLPVRYWRAVPACAEGDLLQRHFQAKRRAEVPTRRCHTRARRTRFILSKPYTANLERERAYQHV